MLKNQKEMIRYRILVIIIILVIKHLGVSCTAIFTTLYLGTMIGIMYVQNTWLSKNIDLTEGYHSQYRGYQKYDNNGGKNSGSRTTR